MQGEWEWTASGSCDNDESEIFYDDQTDMTKYWFVSLKFNTQCRADVKELTQLPEQQFKEKRRHRHFDYLKYAV